MRSARETIMITSHRGRVVRATLLLALLAFGAVAVTPAAPAAHGCSASTSTATLMIGPGQAYSTTFYVAVDVPSAGDLFVPLPWIYQETNAMSGLQRHDDWRDDTCRGEVLGDLLIF